RGRGRTAHAVPAVAGAGHDRRLPRGGRPPLRAHALGGVPGVRRAGTTRADSAVTRNAADMAGVGRPAAPRAHGGERLPARARRGLLDLPGTRYRGERDIQPDYDGRLATASAHPAGGV